MIAFGPPLFETIAGTPAAERCNALDDDCDGVTDEDFTDLGDACTADGHELLIVRAAAQHFQQRCRRRQVKAHIGLIAK